MRRKGKLYGCYLRSTVIAGPQGRLTASMRSDHALKETPENKQ
jgi:hypothetical protein